MKSILRFKHWQLFILIVLTGTFVAPSPIQEIVHTVGLITMAIWLYSIVIFGQGKLKMLNIPTLKTKLFKINVVLYPILINIVLFLDHLYAPKQNELNVYTILFALIVLYWFFALFHCMWLAIKTITMLELKKEVLFSECLKNLFQFIFLILCIWYLQPKITRLIADN
ncbi:MAG: hypothetical protein ACPGSD_09985 [Flavobacteriales bacterium]